MHTIQSLQAYVQDAIAKESFVQEPHSLYIPIDYALRQGGKRIRPVLCLMGCDLFGGDIQQAIKSAIAIEIFHNFTLLHDDIMDNSPLRRGKPTVHRQWNSNIAILAGDTMFALAYKYIAQTEQSLIYPQMQVFTQTAIEICEGQQLDMDYENHSVVEIADYMQMIRLKTGVLLGCALKMGALIAHAPEPDAQRIYDFGVHVGLAFQLQDDLLDCWSDVNAFGKITGTDITDNKKTFLYLKALELANSEQHSELQHYFSSRDFDREIKVNAVRTIYETLNVKQAAIQKMTDHYQQAISAIDSVAVAPERKTQLVQFATSLMDRQY